MINISANVIALIRLRRCDSANVNIFNIFSTANANGIGVGLFFHTENSTEFFHTPIIYGDLDGSMLSEC